MDSDDYRERLKRILAVASADVAAKLVRFRDAATDAVVIDLFVEQGGEGPFDVWARFEGADAFALDRRFDEERHLFGVVWGERGWDPDVPSRRHGWSWEEFESVVFEAVAGWLEPLIPSGGPDWELASVDGSSEPRLLRVRG